MADAEKIWQDVQTIREKGPLVHNITNYVVMNTTANALLAIGASPVMAHAIEEVEEIVGIAKFVGGALVINIGTADSSELAYDLGLGIQDRRAAATTLGGPEGIATVNEFASWPK